MSPRSSTPIPLEEVLMGLPSSRVPIDGATFRAFNDLAFDPCEAVNSPTVAAEGKMTRLVKQALDVHNRDAAPAKRLHLCPVRDGCKADSAIYCGPDPARTIEALNGKLAGIQNKMFRYSNGSLQFTYKRCNADLYDGLLMLIGLRGVPGFWIIPWAAIRLRTSSWAPVNEGSAPGCCSQAGKMYVMSYTTADLAELSRFFVPYPDVADRLVQILHQSAEYKVLLQGFPELNLPTSVWQRCELAGSLQIRLLVLLSLGWPAAYPDEESCIWDVAYRVQNTDLLLRTQEKSFFAHEARDAFRVHLCGRESAVPYSYGPEERPAPDADVFAYTANACVFLRSAKEVFQKGLLRGSRGGELVPGMRQEIFTKGDLDLFTPITSVEALKHVRGVCERAVRDLQTYSHNRPAVEMPTDDILDLLLSELSFWFDKTNMDALLRIAKALEAANFDDAELEEEYEATVLRAMSHAATVMADLSAPLQKADEVTFPLLARIQPLHVWRAKFVPRKDSLSTITEVYKGSMRGFEGVTCRGNFWAFELADFRDWRIRTGRRNGLRTEWEAARAYDHELLSQHPLPSTLWLTNAARLLAARGSFIGLKPNHKLKTELLNHCKEVEVDPMVFFGGDETAPHAPYPGVRRTPPAKQDEEPPWQARVDDRVCGYANTAAEAADMADPDLDGRANDDKAHTSAALLGVALGTVAESVSVWRARALASRLLAQLADAQSNEEAAEAQDHSEVECRMQTLPSGWIPCRTTTEKDALVEMVLEEHESYGVPEPPPIAEGEHEEAEEGARGNLQPQVDLESYRRDYLSKALLVIDAVYEGAVGPSHVASLFEQLAELRDAEAAIKRNQHTIEMLAGVYEGKSRARGIDPSIALVAAGVATGLPFKPTGYTTFDEFRRLEQGLEATRPEASS